MGIFMLFSLRLFVVVYKLAMFMERCSHCSAYVYKLAWSLVLTPASYRYILLVYKCIA